MTVWQWIGDAIWTSLPVLGVGVIVWLLFRSIVRADRNERDAYAKIEAEIMQLPPADRADPTVTAGWTSLPAGRHCQLDPKACG